MKSLPCSQESSLHWSRDKAALLDYLALHLHILISIINQHDEITKSKAGLLSRNNLIPTNGVSSDSVYAAFHSLRPHPSGDLGANSSGSARQLTLQLRAVLSKFL